jgi:methionyl-tRNA synthetase
MANQAAQHNVSPAKADISFEDFSKLDIRIGTILTAEKVAKTKKLLRLTVDTGIDQRTVVSGIAEFHEPEKIIGQKVVILVNLAPREIKGILSQGMILMAENAKGELAFVTSSGEVGNGDEVR